MEPTQITCTRVDEEDLDARYLAGTLSDEEAEAFEEHYFACERCWGSVQLGLDVRAASEAPTPEPLVHATPLIAERGDQVAARRLARRRWWPVAMAASIAIIAVGVWQRGDRSGPVPISDGLRGPTDSIQAVAFTRGRALGVRWTPARAADQYGVRLQKGDATVVVERFTSDTSFTIPRDSLSAVAEGERVYWEVRALDALRRTVARSRLIPAAIPDGRR